MSIKQIFDEIANESSTNKKMDILRSYKDTPLLQEVLYLANSKRIKYYLKQLPSYTRDAEVSLNLEEALFGLSEISNRLLTGHAAIHQLKTILAATTPDDAYIIERIIEKDCKIGMGTSNMNKVFPKLIEDTPYMGAKAYSIELIKKIIDAGYAFSQIKMDGRYANAILRGGEAELESRQGEPTIITGAKFINELTSFDIDCVLNGELTIEGISRYESNGIIASLISISKKQLNGEDVAKEVKEFEAEHMPYKEALTRIKFTVWDILTIDEYFEAKSDKPYSERLNKLEDVLTKAKSEMIEIIKTKKVYTFAEAIDEFQEALKNGEEGTIIKASKGKWKDGKPNWQVKLKLEMDVDLKIVGFNYGTGKNANVISSVNAESSDGLVFTRPTGIDEKTMRHITDHQDKLLGKVLQVKCCGLSQDSTGKYSLLHPVYVMLRDDKVTCDSLKTIQAIENMAKGLK